MFKVDNRKRTKAWPRHTPGRKETMSIQPKNRPIIIPVEEKSFASVPLMPLKRKYQANRAFMQSPVGAPAQPKKFNKRANFPMSRNRAIPSPLRSIDRG